jgi:methionine-gamma-lyase
LQCVDLKGVAAVAHQHGCWLMVDNTFATPYCQRPLSLGADIVVHSTTKYLSGHGVIIGGAVVSPHVKFIRNELKLILKTIGASPSPFDAWLLNLGLKTFELRMQRHCENALVLARYLEKHPKIERVYYPGLESHADHEIASRQMSSYGGMISFELVGGVSAGEKLMNSVQLISLAVSLGMVDSLISHPASMTHAGVPRDERLKMGLTDGLVRFSVGIENVEDIVADLDQALVQI